jgi:hypothetical protein
MPSLDAGFVAQPAATMSKKADPIVLVSFITGRMNFTSVLP